MKQWTDVGLIPHLGAGWRVVQQGAVTAANRNDWVGDIPADCPLRKYFSKVSSAGDYVPPIGWWYVEAEDSDGNEDILWISPAGQTWSNAKCTRSATGRDPQYQVDKVSAGLGLGALLAAGAAAYFLTREKKGAKSNPPRAWNWVIGAAAIGVGYLAVAGKSTPPAVLAKVKKLVAQHMTDYPDTINPSWKWDKASSLVTVTSNYKSGKGKIGTSAKLQDI